MPASPLLRWLLLVLAIAAANYLSGRLGLLLALPPGFATAVWPPSGIALAALLLFGYRVWPGVLLGSFAINIFIAMQSGPIDDWFSAGRVAANIGLGSTVQAALGTWLIRRFVGFPNPLLFEREITLFLLLGGPVSCLFAATVGIGTLVGAGIMPWAVAPFQWWTWWIGDTIGVLTVMPLLLIALAKPREVWRARLGPVGVPLLVTFAIAVLIFVYASRVEQARIEAASDRQRENLAVAMSRGLEQKLDVLYAMAGLFEASSDVSRTGFHIFANQLLPRTAGVQAISWNPRVTQRQREDYERRARMEGVAGFQFFELGQDARNPAAAREEYVPILYVEPPAGNEAALGFDVASEPMRRAVLDRARDSGRAAVSDPLTLIQEFGRQRGVFLACPVYGGSAPRATVAERRQNLSGFVVLVLRTGDLVASALRPVAADRVIVALYDESAQPGNRELLAPQTLDGVTAPAGAASSIPIEFADRHWVLQLTLATGQRSLVAWAVLAGGMLFTSLLGAFLLAVTGRAIHVRRLMEETREAMVRLQDTQKHLVLAEKLAALGGLVAGVSHEINTPLGIGVTAASHLQNEVNVVLQVSAEGNLTKSQFERFLNNSKQAADMILRNLERAAELIRSFKRIAVDQATEERRTIELKAYFEETLLSLKPRLKGTPHRVVLDCPDALELDTIPGALSQILTNLVVNSMVHAFTPERAGVMNLQVSSAQGQVTLRFSDDGCGIAAEHLPQIFDPFFTTRRGQGGTGLGLNIVYNIVTQSLGGTIEVASTPGQGTVFTIRLPARSPAG